MVIFLNLDGSCQKITPEHIYQGSDNVTDITVVAPFSPDTAMGIGFILPNGRYWTNDDGVRYMPMEFAEQSVNQNISAWHFALPGSVTAAMGDLYIAFNAVTIMGNTTSYMCKVQIEESVLPNDAPPPDMSVYDYLKMYLARLDGRTKYVPNLVARIQKVEGSNNAFTYTDNSGVVSDKIILGDPYAAPIPINAASTIKIPDKAWQPTYAEDNTTVTGYTYLLTSAMHGQMRDGATARDLWVSFDEAVTGGFKGVTGDYTMNESGDITITVNQPVAMTVRVWNGKGLADKVARDDIAAETERAEQVEHTLRADMNAADSNLQEQINELMNTGIDTVARAAIAAETERAESAESELRQDLNTAQAQLQGQISVNTSDIQGLREDIANESHFRGMYNSVEELRAAYPTATPNDYAWISGGNIWIYTNGAWTDSGKPVPSSSVPKGTATPLMDGTASAGTSTAYSSEDHRHPSDTTKANTSGSYPNLTVGAATKATNDGNGNSIITTYVKHTFNETSSSPIARTVQHYIGQEVNMRVPALRETAFVFTNCWGNVNVSSNNVKVYIVNSPYLTVGGKDAQNWQNIYVDGLAAYSYKGSLTIPGGHTAPIFETEFKEGDEIQISGIAGENPVNFSFRLTTVRSEQFYNIVYLTPGFYYGRASVYLEGNFLVIKDVKEWYIGSGSPYEQQFTLRSFTIRRQI